MSKEGKTGSEDDKGKEALKLWSYQFSSVQLLSHVRLFATS